LPKRVVKYSILLTIKESYLFVRNWIGLVCHPFRTLYGLFREQDFSQIFLIIGFPLYVLIGGLGIIWVGRRLIDATPGQWGILTKGSVSLVALVAMASFLYLGFWLWQIWKVRK
jgi:hypothetical protein